jgi:hypothetical protein
MIVPGNREKPKRYNLQLIAFSNAKSKIKLVLVFEKGSLIFGGIGTHLLEYWSNV